MCDAHSRGKKTRIARRLIHKFGTCPCSCTQQYTPVGQNHDTCGNTPHSPRFYDNTGVSSRLNGIRLARLRLVKSRRRTFRVRRKSTTLLRIFKTRIVGQNHDTCGNTPHSPRFYDNTGVSLHLNGFRLACLGQRDKPVLARE